MPLPVPVLDDLDWIELFEEGRDRIPAHAPAWTDHNVHDPGITILDLLAWFAEQANFRIDQIPDHHRLRFAALLGDLPAVAAPATAVLQLTAAGPAVSVPPGATAEAHTDAGVVPFVTDRPARATGARLVGLATDGVGIAAGAPFDPLGRDGGGTLTISLEPPPPPGPLHLWIESEDEPPPPASGPHHAVELEWEVRAGGAWQPVAPADVTDGTAALTRSGFVDLTVPAAEALRCRVRTGRYDRAPRLAAIVPNAVTARQLSVRSLAGVRPAGLRIELGSPAVQEVAVASQPPGGVATQWTVRRTPRREPDRPVVLFDPAAGALRFSDGRWGRRPRDDEVFVVWLLDSLGAAGNVGTGAAWSLAAHPTDVHVQAPWGARGATAAESTTDAIARAAGRLWAHERLATLATGHDTTSLDGLPRAAVDATDAPPRAVTALDYERLALATPGVRLARARAWVDLDLAVPCAQAPGTVSVVVVPHLPAGRPEPTRQLLGEVSDVLAARKTLGTRLQVRGPGYTAVTIRVSVAIAAGADPAKVTAAVDAAVRRFLDPLRGGPGGHGWPFGRDVYRTEIMAAAGEVAGVDLVTDVVLGDEEGCSNLCVPATDLVAVESLRVEVA